MSVSLALGEGGQGKWGKMGEGGQGKSRLGSEIMHGCKGCNCVKKPGRISDP
jgi:hypothetical protein